MRKEILREGRKEGKEGGSVIHVLQVASMGQTNAETARR